MTPQAYGVAGLPTACTVRHGGCGEQHSEADVGAGGFKVTTVETVQPELLVFANGNYAHNTALAVVGYETSTNVSTPIINSYFPIQYRFHTETLLPYSIPISAIQGGGGCSRF